MDSRIIDIDREQLKMMYLTERRELKYMASAFGVSEPTISNRIKEFGLSRPASSVDIDAVRKLYLETGMTIKAIAKEIGFSRTGLRKVIVKAGFLKPRVKVSEAGKAIAKRVLSESELSQMYLVEGMTDAAIGRECGVHNITVAAWRRKHGIKREYLANSVDIPADDLRRMYLDEKQNMESIAKHFECGESTVRAHIIRAGLGLDSKEVAARKLEKNGHRYAHAHKVDGYRMIQIIGHPNANVDGYIGEHRYIAEQAMGRYLEQGEQVHHINIDKADNRIVNLAVIRHAEHSRVHKYMERVGAYMCRLTDKKPAPVVFDRDVFWGGRWVRQIDLALCRDNFMQFETKSDIGHMAFIH